MFRIFAVALALFAGQAQADSALKALNTGVDTKGFEAVGRIEFDGRAFCTGSLIAPDVVLTAAHCLFDADGTPFATPDIRFLAGWRNGRASATRSVTRAVVHPDYLTETDPAARIAHDLALLKLAQPVTNGSVSPFPTDAGPQRGEPVGVVSYAFDRDATPSLQDSCEVLSQRFGVLVLTCDIDFGSSGSPVFRFENGVPIVVSVISAKADSAGRKVALAPALADQLPALEAELAAGGDAVPTAAPAVRRLMVDGGQTAAGAKFLRP